MQISAHQGQQMALLARAIGRGRPSRPAPSPATGAGVAEALPADGKLWCCGCERARTNIGRRYWKEAGSPTRSTHIGPASRRSMACWPRAFTGRIDMAFIDANKNDYDATTSAASRCRRAG